MDDLWDLAVGYYRVAGILENLGRYDEALQLYLTAAEQQEVAAVKRGSRKDLQLLSLFCRKVAAVNAVLGKRGDALRFKAAADRIDG